MSLIHIAWVISPEHRNFLCNRPVNLNGTQLPIAGIEANGFVNASPFLGLVARGTDGSLILALPVKPDEPATVVLCGCELAIVGGSSHPKAFHKLFTLESCETLPMFDSTVP